VSDFDTLRWGDTQTLAFSTVGAAFPTGPQATKQLVHAHWRRPLTWKLLVNIQPSLPAVEAGTFQLIMRLTVGCGGGMQTIPIVFASAPVAGVYAPILQFFDIPAQDMQIAFDVNLAPATDDTLPHAWLFGAFVAPFTEPAGSTDTAALLGQMLQQQPSRADPDNQELPRWMPPGFDDGELRYRR
jgi:hypothetical protein